MKEIDLRTTADLADYFGRSKGSFLFRGQTTHYEDAFYVDVSTSSAVAAWFAAHAFVESPGIEIVDLGQGEKVVTNHKYARYMPTEEDGFIYVFERESRLRGFAHESQGLLESREHAFDGPELSRFTRSMLVDPKPLMEKLADSLGLRVTNSACRGHVPR
jgi:hypothetical protein